MKRGEKRNEPPSKAKPIFSVVDTLPPDIELKSVDFIFSRLLEEDSAGLMKRLKERMKENRAERSRGGLGSDLEVEMLDAYGTYKIRALALCLDGLPDEFVQFVGIPRSDFEWLYDFLRTNDSYNEPYESFLESAQKDPAWPERIRLDKAARVAWSKYTQARSWYRCLYSLVDYLESYSGRSVVSETVQLKSEVHQVIHLTVINGRIGIEPDEFIEAFVGIPAERIRRCKNCRRVFWAKRIEQTGCSVSCSKILRTRKWRETVTAEQKLKYKINRIVKGTTIGE